MVMPALFPMMLLLFRYCGKAVFFPLRLLPSFSESTVMRVDNLFRSQAGFLCLD